MAGEKRSQDYEDARDEKIIIVDIEGTTTSISFVKDTLFPYVRNNLKDYIEKNWENAEFKEDVKKLKEMATKDAADKIEGFVPITDSTTDEEKESLMKNILWQMDNDRKSGGLKQLQGHMWRDAYKSGAVKGHVYEDVPKSLEAWTKDNRKIYVYSSGSVEAQKLLFENTENGSLLKYFTDYYDTEIGEKQQTSSYKNILTKIDTEGKNVLFLTDVTKEAQAAIDAGMSSVIVIREGNAELTSEEKNKFTTIKSFDDLSFKTSAKRVKIDDTIEAEKNDTKVVTDETKKTDKVETTTTATTTDVEMKDVSTSNVEKKENKEDDKPKEEPMQVETKITKVDDVVVTKKEEEKEVKKNDTSVVKNDTSVVKIDEKIEKKNDKVEEPVVKASTSEVKSIEKETTTPTKKITTEETTKKDTVVVDDKKIDENTQVQKKSETTSQKSTEENKSDKIEKTNEKIIVETEETKTKTEIEVKKVEVEKTNNDTTVKTVETTKTEETNDKKDKKDDDIVEKVKNTDEKIADKPITEEVKQNGDSKKSTDKNETTTTTTTTPTPTPTVTVTETETKVPETTKVTNGQKTELNGDSKKVETIEKKETEVKVASVNNETTTSTTTTTTAKTDDEPAKIESAKKEEDEKPKNDDEKQRVNGNTDDKNDKTHQNGVNEEKSKNGESSTDTESFKVKKVVEIIADGAGEAEVAPPVAVVAATS